MDKTTMYGRLVDSIILINNSTLIMVCIHVVIETFIFNNNMYGINMYKQNVLKEL